MLRDSLVKALYGQEQHFRWRGKEVSRIENLSDAVFGFSIALIVMSSDVPASYHELMASMRLVPAFGICFLFLWMLWTRHYLFFRRYGLADTATLIGNAVLMFVTLIYVYPLRFLFAYLLDGMWHVSGVLPEEYQQELAQRLEQAVTVGQARGMMVLYGSGYAAVTLTFAWLHRHALRRAAELELDARERLLTRHEVQGHCAHAVVALASVATTVLVSPALAGWMYFLLFPVGWVQGALLSRALKRLDAAGG